MLDELTTWQGDPSTQSKEAEIVATSDAQSHQPILSGYYFGVDGAPYRFGRGS